MKLKFLALAAVAAVALGASAAKPVVVAHRGFWRAEGSAQNSIRSLIKADSIGCSAVELDVWLSADSVLFVNHNPDIDGIVIETSRSANIAPCRLDNGEPIPTLEQFLEAARPLSTNIVLEVKNHRDTTREDIAVPMIIDMIKAKGLTNRTCYITFSRNAFNKLVAQSGRPVQYLTTAEPSVIKKWGAAGADYHIGSFREHPEWIDQIHSLGMTVNIWTVDSPDDIKWCIDNHADYITTNEPELAAKLIEEAYQE
jgi:glycerophosphoryl diester phosphodiesterase